MEKIVICHAENNPRENFISLEADGQPNQRLVYMEFKDLPMLDEKFCDELVSEGIPDAGKACH